MKRFIPFSALLFLAWLATQAGAQFSHPPSSSGGIGGPASSVDDAVALFSGTGGATLKESNIYGSETGEAGLVRIGGKTSGEVAIKHLQGSVIIAQARTADDSANAAFSGLHPGYNVSSDTTIGTDIVAPDALITNRTNSSALKVITLKASPAVGEEYHFINIDADGLQLLAQGSQVIRYGALVSSAAGTMTTTDVGARLDCIYIGQGFAWVCAGTGTWTPL